MGVCLLVQKLVVDLDIKGLLVSKCVSLFTVMSRKWIFIWKHSPVNLISEWVFVAVF